MKRALGLILLVLFIVGLAVYSLDQYEYVALKDSPYILNHTPLVQEKTAHMLLLYGFSGALGVQCSATTVGPHALLTAQHCYNEAIAELKLDYARRAYHIKAVERDDNEHVIFLLDGPAFTFIQPVVTGRPRINAPVYIYGFGKQNFPGTRKSGVVVDEYDPSELNQREGFFYTSINVIHGDSGSAVYDADGSILGLITFSIDQDPYHQQSGIFPLRFTEEQIQKARTYEYKENSDVNPASFTSPKH